MERMTDERLGQLVAAPDLYDDGPELLAALLHERRLSEVLAKRCARKAQRLHDSVRWQDWRYQIVDADKRVARDATPRGEK